VTPQFATTALTFSPDARQAAQLARAAGFMGLLFDAYSSDLSFPDLSLTGRREFRHMVGAQELRIVGLQGDLGPKGLGPGADIDRVVDRVDRAMDAAAGLGSPMLCIDIGPLAEPPRSAAPKPAISPEQAGALIIPAQSAPATGPTSTVPFDQARADSVNNALVELGVRADHFRVTVALRSSLSSFSALEHAIATARCPWFGVDLDPVSMLRDDWNIDEIFSRLGSLIRHVRARDAVAGADRRTKPVTIGQGSIDWRAVLSRLDESAYRSWLTVDPVELPDRPSAAISGLKHLADALRL
jgi:sugar phosphate isomerase/epimerase